MRLVKFSVSNYRNIEIECSFEFANYTVLVGENNQGKTNCLKAIEAAITLLKNKSQFPMSTSLNFADDYPKEKQQGPLLPIRFELTFQLSDIERKKMFKEIGIHNNGSLILSVEALFRTTNSRRPSRRTPVRVSISVKGKRGKASTSYNTNIDRVCSFVLSNFDYVYIPAIRSEDDSLSIIRDLVSIKIKELNSDNDYLDQLASIYEKERTAINTIKNNLIADLKEYIPDINDVSIEPDLDRRMMRGSFEFFVDDGINTPIKNKGAGIISLMALALIQGQSGNNSMVAIEEPESHLHADAIHKIARKLMQTSTGKQIVVSTHNPSFLNPNGLENVYLVKGGCVKKPRRIDEIRQELGLLAKDSLFMSNNVVVVEGESDRRFIKRIIEEYSPKLKSLLDTGNLEIYAASSSSKIVPVINECKRWMVNYFAFFDGDQAGKKDYEALGESGRSYLIQSLGKKNEAELEDVLPPNIIVDALNEINLPISTNDYLKSKKKFHSFFEEVSKKFGYQLTDDSLKRVKASIMDRFCKSDFGSMNQLYTEIYKSMIQRVETCFASAPLQE